jgi:hypothetical protein
MRGLEAKPSQEKNPKPTHPDIPVGCEYIHTL